MKLALIALLSAIPAAQAPAAPAYLSCRAASGDESHHFSVTLDEQSGRVAYTDNANGRSYEAQGSFSEREISFRKTDDLGRIKMSRIFTIDRASRAFTYLFLLESAVGNPEIVSTGRCEAVQAPDGKS